MSESELIQNLLKADDKICNTISSRVESVLQKYQQPFLNIQEMQPINCMLSKCTDQIQQNSQMKRTQQHGENTLEILKEILKLVSSADNVAEQISAMLQTKNFDDSQYLVEEYQQVMQQKQKLNESLQNLDQLPVVKSSFISLNKNIQILIDKLIEHLINELEQACKTNLVKQFPPDYTHLKQIVYSIDVNTETLKIIKTYNPNKYQEIRQVILKTLTQYLTLSSQNLLSIVQASANEPISQRFNDLEIQTIKIAGYQELTDFANSHFSKNKLKNIPNSKIDEVLQQFLLFVLHFLILCEETLNFMFSKEKGILEKTEPKCTNQALFYIIYNLISDQQILVKLTQTIVKQNILVIFPIYQIVKFFKSFTKKLPFPATQQIFEVILDQLEQVVQQHFKQFEETTLQQIQSLKTAIYQTGITHYSMRIQSFLINLVLLDSQAAYDCAICLTKYSQEATSFKDDLQSLLLQSLSGEIVKNQQNKEVLEQLKKKKDDLELKLSTWFEIDTDPIVFFATFQISKSLQVLIQKVVQTSNNQLEYIIKEEKEEIREKYGQLAIIMHLHFIQNYFQKFFKLQLKEYDIDYQQQLERYLLDQLAYKVPWVKFMDQIDTLLQQNFVLQDVPTKPGMGPKEVQKLIADMPKVSAKTYAEMSERIIKQMGDNMIPIGGITAQVLGETQKQLKHKMYHLLNSLVSDKYKRFLNIIEKCYGLKVQMISTTELLQNLNGGLQNFLK
ncbi:Conserved_hypothetical protein [Hexamita inflata]|uniref:Uncharacterized protein n=1 Tax=Hexamita inflata TaxID=28002 RepID=A0AA86R5P8_9EUKA|nr:Conserved hypothetical protein [Hexamita inflata]